VTLADALVGADAFLGLSVGNIVTGDMIRPMAERPIIFAMANPDPEIPWPEATAARPDAIMATGRSDYPNQVNNVLGFPYIFRGALDVRATTINEPMKIAAVARPRGPGRKPIKFGPDYFIPKPFDPRVLWWVAPAVAEAAMASGVARVPVVVDDYRDKLMRRSSNAAFQIMRSMHKTASRDPRRIVFPEAGNLRVLRAVQQILDEDIARPVLLGRRGEIEALCREASLDILDRATVIDPNEPASAAAAERYALRLTELRGRKGVTLAQARSLLRQSNYYGVMMLEGGDVDGLVGGFKRSYPDSVRPSLQVLGLAPGAQVAVGMYMMILQNSVKFFGDTVFTVEPTAEQLADIAVQMADAVAGLGITPRVAMISYSNFGSIRHPDVARVQQALALVRRRRPDLEIDGEMQPEMALDEARRSETYPFSTLTRNANTLVFDRLSSGNAAYQVLECLGGADAVGPILLGVSRPVSLLQNESTVDDIVNMTAYTVMKAQLAARDRPATAV
jgi:malate dehydrogenase (oxaloacetate-decarboxylating)(NADP+)